MSQPTLRCPRCGQMVSLPAEECPCGFNFRTGQGPAPEPSLESESPGGRLTRLHFILGGAAIVVLALLLLIFLLRSPSPAPTPAPVAAGGGSPLAPPPALSDSPLLRPQVPIGQAQGAAQLANDNVQRLRDTQAEIEAERGQ
ncbi:MAG: hypothetical protein LBR11_13075 [Deltaproteobacteria bacterium]|jgi:hypothetical protein|nr:hypothetical protein [Deltaproteobacteria bacterium]